MDNFIIFAMLGMFILYLIICGIILDFELKEIKKYRIEQEKMNEEKEQKELEWDNRKQKREGG